MKGSDSEKERQVTGSKAVYRFVYTKWGQRGDKWKGFSIPGPAKYEAVLCLAKFRTFSFHHLSPGPTVSREKQKSRRGSRLECSLEIDVWDIVLCVDSTLAERQTLSFGLRPKDSDQDGEGTQRHVTGEMTKGMENVYPGEGKAVEREGDNCLENSERLSCEKGIRCVFYGPQRDLRQWEDPERLKWGRSFYS